MSTLTARTPELIAAEINDIKKQTLNMLLYNSIEIGRRLVEAKAMVSHGEWMNWLEKSVNYSQRTAQNLMKIFNEYDIHSKIHQNLSYSQAVELLRLPEEERLQLLTERDIRGLTTRELHRIISNRSKSRKAIPETTMKHLVNKTGGKCEICNWGGIGLEGVLIPHHIKKYSDTEDNTVNNLVMLCPNCHHTIHTLEQCKDKDMLAIIENSVDKRIIDKIKFYVHKLIEA